MSVSSIQSSINQVSKEISKLEKDLAGEAKKEADRLKRITDIQKSITKNTSAATFRSKMGQVERYQNEISRIATKKADINKKIAQKREKLNDLSGKLQKEEQKRSKEQQREQERIHRDYEKRINELTSQLKQGVSVNMDQASKNIMADDMLDEQYDVFISHAWEDKEGFVKELADILIDEYRLKVWYDDFSIKWGDSLRQAIDKGLRLSRFGIVVVSRNFIRKGWTNYELDGLFQKEMTFGKTILPIWHEITKDEVQEFSPSLAGKKALNTAMFTIREIAEELKKVLGEECEYENPIM